MRVQAVLKDGSGGGSLCTWLNGKEGKCKFAVLRVENTLREDQQKVIPLCASIILHCIVGWEPLGYGAPTEQLIQIEIMLRASVQARWLAKYIDIRPSDMPKSKDPEDEEFSP